MRDATSATSATGATSTTSAAPVRRGQSDLLCEQRLRAGFELSRQQVLGARAGASFLQHDERPALCGHRAGFWRAAVQRHLREQQHLLVQVGWRLPLHQRLCVAADLPKQHLRHPAERRSKAQVSAHDQRPFVQRGEPV